MRYLLVVLLCGVAGANGWKAASQESSDSATASEAVGSAQPEASGESPELPMYQQREPGDFLGPESCDDCHTGQIGDFARRDFCRLEELNFWQERDKHEQATALISDTALGQQMMARLGIDPATITEQRQCMTCHGAWHAGQGGVPPRLADRGVSCEVCHGASVQWDTPHRFPEWRQQTPTEKSALGMFDVRDLELRGELCFSCHIGNAELGRVVTHDMYAAGHPPLPGSELETFANEMPLHWLYPSEKGAFLGRTEYMQANYENASDNTYHRTRSVMVGGLVALRESIELFAAQYDGADQTDEHVPAYAHWTFPEFAAFECGACHHELDVDSWRQERIGLSASLAPGRPLPPQWPTVVAAAVLSELDRAVPEGESVTARGERFRELESTFHQAVAQQPFGRADVVTPAAAEWANWLDEQIVDAKELDVTEEVAQRMLGELARVEADTLPDYHSARQRLWAYRIVWVELATGYPARDRFPERSEEEAAAVEPQRDDAEAAVIDEFRQRLAANFNAIDERLQADDVALYDFLTVQLPSGREGSIEASLAEQLLGVAQYHPVEFMQRWQAFLRSVPAPSPADSSP